MSIKVEETICLNQNFSTTRLLAKEEPTIEHHSEDKLDSFLFLSENSDRRNQGGLRTQGYFKKSYEYKPLITVVTVVFNGEVHLEQTILSVIEQDYDNVEYIIVDGASTDGTLDIIRQYENQIDYWVSESDSGIYDAMNKATSLATGEWINFMNAGDYFYDHKVLVSFYNIDLENISIAYGDAINVYSVNYVEIRKNKSLKLFYQGLPFSHQSAFIRTHLLKKESYDDRYRIAADYDFFYKLYRSGHAFFYRPMTVAYYDMFGTSSKYAKLFQERKKIVLKYDPHKLSYYTWKRYLKIKIKEIIKSWLPSELVRTIRIKLAKIASGTRV